MKIRTGFVSNSSSSSFTCLICGYENSGWDASLYDFGLMECENGHIMCEDHVENFEEVLQSHDEARYEFPQDNCPICNFQKLVKDDAIKYLVKTGIFTEEKLLEEFKSKFKTYKEFKEFIKNEN